jgi:hypothetical protein
MQNSSDKPELDPFPIVGPAFNTQPRIRYQDPWQTFADIMELIEQLYLPRRAVVPITGKFLL